MTNQTRIRTEENAVAGQCWPTNFAVILDPGDVSAELELHSWLASGAVLELRTSNGALLADVTASAMTVGANSNVAWAPGTGPLGFCLQPWSTPPWSSTPCGSLHQCRHSEGHAQVSTVAHECACGAKLPI